VQRQEQSAVEESCGCPMFHSRMMGLLIDWLIDCDNTRVTEHHRVNMRILLSRYVRCFATLWENVLPWQLRTKWTPTLTDAHPRNSRMYVHAHTHTQTRTCICLCTHMHAQMHICTQTHIQTYPCMHTLTCMYTYNMVMCKTSYLILTSCFYLVQCGMNGW